MSDLITALITALPPTLMAVVSLIATLRNSGAIKDVHLSLNSRLAELIVAAKAEGRQTERDSNRDQTAKNALVAIDLKHDTAQIASDLKNSTAEIARELKDRQP